MACSANGGGQHTCAKSYSEFHALREELCSGPLGAALHLDLHLELRHVDFPPKRWFGSASDELGSPTIQEGGVASGLFLGHGC